MTSLRDYLPRRSKAKQSYNLIKSLIVSLNLFLIFSIMVDIQPLIETASDDSSAEEQERELRRRRKDKKKPEVKTGESTRQDDDRLERIFKAEDAAKKVSCSFD